MLHLHHLLAVVVVVVVGQVENGLSLLFAQYLGRHFLLVGVVVGNPSILGGLGVVGNLGNMTDKLGNVVRLRQYQHDLDVTLGGQDPQQFLQLVSGLGVQSDERIIHDKELRVGKQCLCQLKLSQFTTREGDNILVEKLLHVEQLVQVGLQGPALWGVLTSQAICLFQQFAYGRRLVVDVVLVPAQLQVILSVHVHTIRICKGDIAHTVGGQLFAQPVNV